MFGLIVTLFLVIDAATGGKIKATTSNGKVKYGTWAPDALFPRMSIPPSTRSIGRLPLTSTLESVYAVSGIAYGMVELIRRVIPRE